jgi:hypothetical protein
MGWGQLRALPDIRRMPVGPRLIFFAPDRVNFLESADKQLPLQSRHSRIAWRSDTPPLLGQQE